MKAVLGRILPFRPSFISKQVQKPTCGLLCELHDILNHGRFRCSSRALHESLAQGRGDIFYHQDPANFAVGSWGKKIISDSLTNTGSIWSPKLMALFHLANTLIRRRPEPFNPEIFPNSCEEGRRVRLFSKPTKYCWGAAFVSQVLKQSTTN